MLKNKPSWYHNQEHTSIENFGAKIVSTPRAGHHTLRAKKEQFYEAIVEEVYRLRPGLTLELDLKKLMNHFGHTNPYSTISCVRILLRKRHGASIIVGSNHDFSILRVRVRRRLSSVRDGRV
jgi:hypothetical protein